MGLVLVAVFLPIVAVIAVFARRQDRLNRAMAAMDSAPQEAGYVGPHVTGPT